MSMQQLTLPGDIVKKSNTLIRNKISIESVTSARVLASLIATIRVDDTEFKDLYKIKVSDFIADDSGRGYKNVKLACDELAKSFVSFENKKEKDYDVLPFFMSISLRKGVITAKFNPLTKPYLLELKENFTQYNVLEYLKLPSIYSQRMFELLKSYSKLPECFFTIEELHRILNVPDSFNRYPDFRRRVLDKAHKDINAKTGLKYEWEAVKKGKSVIGIRFIFSNKRMLSTRAVVKKEEQVKTSKENNKIYLIATDCAKNKNGICQKIDNKKTVCDLCLQFNFCDEILRANKQASLI